MPFCREVDNRYELIHKIGEGRYAKVYMTLDKKLDKIVALKLLRPTNLRSKLFKFL